MPLILSSVNSDMKNFIRDLLRRYPYLSIEFGKKHLKLVNKNTGDFVAISRNNSDFRTWRNQEKALVRLAVYGTGYIAKRKENINSGEIN